jgi:hypothetical protein
MTSSYWCRNDHDPTSCRHHSPGLRLDPASGQRRQRQWGNRRQSGPFQHEAGRRCWRFAGWFAEWFAGLKICWVICWVICDFPGNHGREIGDYMWHTMTSCFSFAGCLQQIQDIHSIWYKLWLGLKSIPGTRSFPGDDDHRRVCFWEELKLATTKWFDRFHEPSIFGSMSTLPKIRRFVERQCG